MAKPYIKLDLDWREDAKVILFESRYKRRRSSTSCSSSS